MTGPGIPRLLEIFTAGDDVAAEEAALAFARQGAAALPALERLFQSGSAETRWWALRTAAEIPGREALHLLAAGLDDPDLAVRQCAAVGLHQVLPRAGGSEPPPALLPALVRCLEDQDALLRRLAGEALVALGASAVPALIAILANGPAHARPEAARALAGLRDPRSIPVFFQCIQEGDTSLVEHWANEGLERLGVGMVFFNAGG